MRGALFVIMGMLSATGCDGAETIGCDWFAGSNCWKESAAAANSCVPESETGIFNGDRTECSFADGTKVTFATPAPASVGMGEYVWDFTITKAGATCASFRETGTDGDGGFELVTSMGTFSEEVSGTTLRITCPAGDEVKIGVFDALECDFSNLPGTNTFSSASRVGFTLNGSSPSRALFECEQATTVR